MHSQIPTPLSNSSSELGLGRKAELLQFLPSEHSGIIDRESPHAEQAGTAGSVKENNDGQGYSPEQIARAQKRESSTSEDVH